MEIPSFSDVFGSGRYEGEVPLLLWNPAYKSNDTERLRWAQGVSDLLRLRRNCLYSKDFPNPKENRRRFAGEIDEEEYSMFTHTFGGEGSVAMRDSHFFHPVEQALRGKIVGSRLNLKTFLRSETLLAERRRRRAERAAAVAVAEMVKAAQQQSGQDLSFLAEPPPPPDEDEDLEALLLAGLLETDARYPLIDLRLETLTDRMQDNSEMAILEEVGKQIRWSRLTPEQVGWLSGKPRPTTGRDMDAIGVHDWLSLPDAMTMHGPRLGGNRGFSGLKAQMEKLTKPGTGPAMDYHSGNVYLNSSHDFGATQAGDGGFWVGSMEGDGGFYRAGPGRAMPSLLRQRCWFKLVRPQAYLLKIDNANPSDSAWEAYQHTYKQDRESALSGDRLRYVPVEDDHRAKGRERLVWSSKTEVWKLVRLGHSVLLELGPDPLCPALTAERPDAPIFPVAIQITWEKAFVTIGAELQKYWNVCFNRLSEAVNLMGSDEAMVIDEAQLQEGTDPQLIKYTAKKAGIIVVDSSLKVDHASPLAQLHLKVVKNTSTNSEINSLLMATAAIHQVWANLTGLNPAFLTQQADRTPHATSQMAAENQSLLSRNFFHHHNAFVNQCVQLTADRGRMYWAGDGYRDFHIGGGVIRTLRTRPDLASIDLGVIVENSAKAAEDKQFIMSMYKDMMNAGNPEIVGKIVEHYLSDNPAIGRKIWETVKSDVEAQREAQGQASNQLAAQRNEVEAQKAQVPLQVEQLRSQNKLALKQLSMQQDAGRQAFKGQQADVSAAGRREEMALESQLIPAAAPAEPIGSQPADVV